MRLNFRPRFWLIIIAIMVITFGASCAIAQRSLSAGRQALRAAQLERRALQEQVADLQDELAYKQTDEYIIRTARNEKGMLMPDEVFLIGN